MLEWMKWRPEGQSEGMGDLCFLVMKDWQMLEFVVVLGWW
jgi:hypothetical protein